jgi:hypothetical protein
MAHYEEWDPEIRELFDETTHGEAQDDEFLQSLFDLAFVDMDVFMDDRTMGRELFAEWLEDNYGIDFDVEFDWGAWKEWYDSQ